jgi:Protein of unknown function (DUF3455)
MKHSTLSCCLVAAVALATQSARADVADTVAAPGERPVTVVQAIGAQVYECKPDAQGNPKWKFREPIASLMIDGKTVGRHFDGPNWEMVNGSAVTAKVVARAPGATPRDIPLLKLEVTAHRGAGRLASVTTVQRLNTSGGVLDGSCPSAGRLMSVPYTAEYRFLQKVD